MNRIEDKRPEWLTPARVLADIAHFETRTAYDEDIDDMSSILSLVIMFDQVSRETSFICYDDPDIFLMKVEEAIECGFRPIAMEITKGEEHDYEYISLEYFDEPTLEDEAIIESLFNSNYGIKVSA